MDSTLEKGLRVLDYLAQASGPVRLSTLAQDLGLQKSNAHRTLATLVASNYAVQDAETGMYQPSLKLFELGAKVLAGHPVRKAATPYCQKLQSELGETVNLYVLDGDSVLVVEKLISPRPIRFSSRPGSRLPVPASAAGRVMLAFHEDPEGLYDRSLGVVPLRSDTKIVRDDVLSGLPSVRLAGYFEADPDWKQGIFSIAVPILDEDRRVLGAIGISGPVERYSPEKRRQIIEALMSVTAMISETGALG
ncbi:IclR family transcriptional regulator [Ponticaulis sp.]|uniref:IclR family transcriptional regulator n=1 Tax=Ponticaulis sp. TaxID=2020902 RepID=UPI00260E2A29|nr:IclR family transcriptional regulator [Ponticaulis sp.]MDF1679400.1 IclR family transcriptional regulator [Ponticaulis sp.]